MRADILLLRMKMFKNISVEMKKELFLATLKNDLRWDEDKQLKEYMDITNVCKKFDCVENFIKSNALDISKKNKSIEDLMRATKESVVLITKKPIFQTLAINYVLYKNELCPLLNYAFDKWYYKEKYFKELFLDQVELSTTYLYRLIKLEKNDITAESKPNGAYSYISIDYANNILQKAPKNLAASSFANEEEYKTMKLLNTTELRTNIPSLIGYDVEKSIIKKQYISGILGHDMLQNNNLDLLKISKLNKLYKTIVKVSEESGIKLDVHPSNFVWSEKENKWYLIDLGIVPKIGYDYYPKNFDEYFQKIWLERFERMKKFPIRSVEI